MKTCKSEPIALEVSLLFSKEEKNINNGENPLSIFTLIRLWVAITGAVNIYSVAIYNYHSFIAFQRQ